MKEKEFSPMFLPAALGVCDDCLQSRKQTGRSESIIFTYCIQTEPGPLSSHTIG